MANIAASHQRTSATWPCPSDPSGPLGLQLPAMEKRKNVLHCNSPILVGVELNLHERLWRKKQPRDGKLVLEGCAQLTHVTPLRVLHEWGDSVISNETCRRAPGLTYNCWCGVSVIYAIATI